MSKLIDYDDGRTYPDNCSHDSLEDGEIPPDEKPSDDSSGNYESLFNRFDKSATIDTKTTKTKKSSPSTKVKKDHNLDFMKNSVESIFKSALSAHSSSTAAENMKEKRVKSGHQPFVPSKLKSDVADEQAEAEKKNFTLPQDTPKSSASQNTKNATATPANKSEKKSKNGKETVNGIAKSVATPKSAEKPKEGNRKKTPTREGPKGKNGQEVVKNGHEVAKFGQEPSVAIPKPTKTQINQEEQSPRLAQKHKNRPPFVGCCDSEMDTDDGSIQSSQYSKRIRPNCDSSIDSCFDEQLDDDLYELVDSHCHLDYIFGKIRNGGNLCQWMKGFPRCFPPQFKGCITNFIEPNLFVEGFEESKYDMEWILSEVKNPYVLGATYGCHPRFADQWDDEVVDTMRFFCQNRMKSKIVAIGECGLDFHNSKVPVDVQRRTLTEHVRLAVEFELPIVIHCRSGRIDAEDMCLETLKRANLPRFHNIHRHCFTGSLETAKKWINAFPNVYFGFTYVISSFKPQELEVVRQLDMSRILLETDAPYFRPPEFNGLGPSGTSLPGMAISVARIIARERGMTLRDLLIRTAENTKRMYVLNYDGY